MTSWNFPIRHSTPLAWIRSSKLSSALRQTVWSCKWELQEGTICCRYKWGKVVSRDILSLLSYKGSYARNCSLSSAFLRPRWHCSWWVLRHRLGVWQRISVKRQTLTSRMQLGPNGRSYLKSLQNREEEKWFSCPLSVSNLYHFQLHHTSRYPDIWELGCTYSNRVGERVRVDVCNHRPKEQEDWKNQTPCLVGRFFLPILCEGSHLLGWIMVCHYGLCSNSEQVGKYMIRPILSLKQLFIDKVEGKVFCQYGKIALSLSRWIIWSLSPESPLIFPIKASSRSVITVYMPTPIGVKAEWAEVRDFTKSAD